jgi:antitoxin HicB
MGMFSLGLGFLQACTYSGDRSLIIAEVRMTTERRYTIHLRPEPEGGFTVLVPAIPEVVSYGETYEEAMAMAQEAIEAVLETYREQGWEIPDDVEMRIDHLTIAA